MQWLFEWVGGGYNTVLATTRADALAQAQALGKPRTWTDAHGRHTTIELVVNETTLHVTTPAEVASYDRRYGSMFD